SLVLPQVINEVIPARFSLVFCCVFIRPSFWIEPSSPMFYISLVNAVLFYVSNVRLNSCFTLIFRRTFFDCSFVMFHSILFTLFTRVQLPKCFESFRQLC